MKIDTSTAAVVTGGASGLGKATAEALAAAGVNGLVLPMARDLMDLGLRVNAIMRGIFATPLMLGARPQVLDSLSASVPFPKRLGKPGEFASLVLELIRNTYFNGQAIHLDGGIRMAPR